jgi:hypothetical protein
MIDYHARLKFEQLMFNLKYKRIDFQTANNTTQSIKLIISSRRGRPRGTRCMASRSASRSGVQRCLLCGVPCQMCGVMCCTTWAVRASFRGSGSSSSLYEFVCMYELQYSLV